MNNGAHAYASTEPGNQSQGRGPKEIGGSPYKRWRMWFNSTILVQPYQPVFRHYFGGGALVLHGCRQLVLWSVLLSQRTSATRSAICCVIAPAVDVKSIRSALAGPLTCNKAIDNGG